MDMRALWKGQPAPVADLDAMRRRIRRFALRRIGEACAVIVLMMAAIAAGGRICTCWPPGPLLTRLGLVLACRGVMLPVWSFARVLRVN